jgi:uncharacterized Zn finger protein (UPF0148 family)
MDGICYICGYRIKKKEKEGEERERKRERWRERERENEGERERKKKKEKLEEEEEERNKKILFVPRRPWWILNWQVIAVLFWKWQFGCIIEDWICDETSRIDWLIYQLLRGASPKNKHWFSMILWDCLANKGWEWTCEGKSIHIFS